MDMFIINRPRVIPRQMAYQVVKRLMDVAICLVTLPLLLPFAALCALAIRLDSPGPAILVQERIGKGGRPFRLYKFRTMHHSLDNSSHRIYMKAYVNGSIGLGHEHNLAIPAGGNDVRLTSSVSLVGQPNRETPKPIQRHPGAHAYEDELGPIVYKPARGAHITRIGRLLRKTSVDELPQILNILKGEMSLVGPRPNVPWEVEEYRPWHHERLEVLPGLTGLAQVRGRSEMSFVNLVRSDIEYVEKQSLALDLKILWRTFALVLTGKGTC